MDVQKTTINAIRILSAEAIEKAKSGHPGLPMGCAPIAYTLFQNFLKFNAKDLTWQNRDRFVLSAGHGSTLYYSLLHLYGMGLSMEDLQNFRQFGSKTPAHPEYGHTAGVETTTGPLGQGIANAVGMALAEAHLAAKYNKPVAWKKASRTKLAPLQVRISLANSFFSTTITKLPLKATLALPLEKTWVRVSQRKTGKFST